MKTAIFTTIILLLTTMGLSAEKRMTCKGGVCMIDLSCLSNTSNVKKDRHNRFRIVRKNESSEIETIILPHEKYIMATAETEDILITEDENIDSKIIKKSLPVSEFFCEKDTKVVYHKETATFECA